MTRNSAAVLGLGLLTLFLAQPIGVAAVWAADRYCDRRERRGFVPYGRRVRG